MQGNEDMAQEHVKLVVQAAIDICSAMVYVHEQGFIHRDIKPQNCLVTSAAGSVKVKLSDFAFARKLPTEAEGAENMSPNRGSLQ